MKPCQGEKLQELFLAGIRWLPGILILVGIFNFGFGVSDASAGWTEGKYNSAIDFNGTTTYVDGFGAIGNIKTVSFWMKADSLTEDVIENLRDRDIIDSSRADSPLKMAEDAYEIDTSDITFDEQVNKILELIKEKVALA